MPELPEVEALRRSLEPCVVGQKVRSTHVRLPKLVSAKGTTRQEDATKTKEFQNSLLQRRFINLRRRSKNLIFGLDDGGQLLVHLKMSGQLVYQGRVQEAKTKKNKAQATTQETAKPAALEPNETEDQGARTKEELVWGGHPIELTEHELPNKHTHVIFELDSGTLFYNDVRQFGYLLYFPSLEELESSGHFDDLGLEPLSPEFTLEKFQQAMAKRKGNLKKMFLDQKVVVGLGNIYADEVCFAAGVRPTRSLESLKPKEVQKLYESIRQILPVAIEDGGSSVASYLLGDGSRGNYAKKHFVYNRGGQQCKVCGSQLVKVKVAGRTTVYCPVCQK